MTQADRDRLVTLKKAKKKLITQGDAAEELGVSRRHVKRLLKAWNGVRNVLNGWLGVIPRPALIRTFRPRLPYVYAAFG